MILDTNIIIYSATRPELRRFIRDNGTAASAISMVEALGFHRHTPQELAALEEVFSLIPVLDIGGPIIDRAIALRQARKMKLGDAIIAATALVAGLTLATHDADFANIPGLTVHDPLANP